MQTSSSDPRVHSVLRAPLDDAIGHRHLISTTHLLLAHPLNAFRNMVILSQPETSRIDATLLVSASKTTERSRVHWESADSSVVLYDVP